MALTHTFCLEGAGNTKIAVSQEGLRAIVRHAEWELYRSEIYQQVLNGLQQQLGDAAEGCQALLKSLSREAIRLALRQLVKQYRVIPTAIQGETQQSSSLAASNTANLDVTSVATLQSPAPAAEVSSLSSDSSDTEIEQQVQATNAAPPPPPSHSTGKSTKRRKAEPIAIEQERDMLLRQLGQELKRVRQAKSLSVEQLHTITWVPLHQIKALEAGQIDQLPEDIYVRGFVRRIADALNLDGSGIADSIPVPERAKSVIPSWHRSVKSSPSLGAVHLYVGYAALMAGAVGGLAWMSQPMSESLPNASQPDLKAEPLLEPAYSAEPSTNSASTNNGMGISQPDIMPPESLPF